MPVRKLLEGLPTLLPALKPCLMMSPLTVSHFLSPDHRFDLVIFDEASQVPPQDAINCIYRGEQLIVAGDSKQLPPTPFFQLADPEGEEYDEEEDLAEEDMESILDSCEALLPSAVAAVALPKPSRAPDLVLEPAHLRRQAGDIPSAGARVGQARRALDPRTGRRLRPRSRRAPTASRRGASPSG